MKILIIGKSGQLANELLVEQPQNYEVLALGRNDVDITNFKALDSIVAEYQPTVVINSAAYTAVDKAESDVEAAYAINHIAVENLAKIAKKYSARLVHVSTDFVFNGENTTPYKVDDITSPTSVYGASKRAGELAIIDNYPENASIIRTSWLYSTFANNFVKTMLRLMEEKEELGIVNDQVGSPTSAKGLAKFIWALIAQPKADLIYHWCDSGSASWFDFALAIQEEGLKRGLLTKKIPIKGIPSSAYPTPAKRPKYSVLDCTSSQEILASIDWQKQLSDCLAKYNK
ncbi:dTDP-4-dehydrorhamnose reductase [Pseudocolwellia sp. AS88]|uniref:dTDP-4-dehydrorhamnose reductase n=1 Tax=Pseudocolwellia sp. AS88 TaxID=3063958 RepID=UPI0026EA7ABD|nr:dTDP-4-dehydrorhamnose reductase [Pseudocolwellia sp. AS88]MDO7085036.1 dTDP-4-dehydrorhamnose reductase [Pseudocolwellia sp. AS88]